MSLRSCGLQTHLSVLATWFCPSYSISLAPLKVEGAGKTGCALHPRSHVQSCIKENAHMSIQVQRKHSGLPCAMARRLIRALPGDPALLTPLLADRSANVTPTLRRQDHAISPYACLRLVHAQTCVHRDLPRRQ